MDKTIRDNLLPYQIVHTENIVRIINKNKTVLDASDTGTGKTYTAIASCAILKLNPFIICPKSVMSVWRTVCKIFNVNNIGITNYEMIRRGKYYEENKKRICPYLTVNKKDYAWDMPKNSVFIFDEAHKCSDLHTYNSRMLFGAKESNNPIMLLSATIADHPEKFKIFFYILNFIDPEIVKRKQIEFKQYMRIIDNWIMRDQRPMVRIHHMLYPDRGTRMRIDVLGDMFPETQITSVPYQVSKKREKEIQKEYSIISKELDNLHTKGKKDKGNILVKIMRSHQRIELIKVPLFVELANDFIHNGHSVVIFVNFTQTLKLLSEMLHTDVLIYGEQSGEEREKNIEKFQSNRSGIIICNIKAGGLGLSLHDIHGGYPRVSLISPTFNAIELTQALGRVHRAGGKSKSLQRIIYCANTVEERIADKLKIKLKSINSINNGDVDLTNIVFSNEFNEL